LGDRAKVEIYIGRREVKGGASGISTVRWLNCFFRRRAKGWSRVPLISDTLKLRISKPSHWRKIFSKGRCLSTPPLRHFTHLFEADDLGVSEAMRAVEISQWKTGGRAGRRERLLSSQAATTVAVPAPWFICTALAGVLFHHRARHARRLKSPRRFRVDGASHALGRLAEQVNPSQRPDFRQALTWSRHGRHHRDQTSGKTRAASALSAVQPADPRLRAGAGGLNISQLHHLEADFACGWPRTRRPHRRFRRQTGRSRSFKATVAIDIAIVLAAKLVTIASRMFLKMVDGSALVDTRNLSSAI
jgi:hypothetical protein